MKKIYFLLDKKNTMYYINNCLLITRVPKGKNFIFMCTLTNNRSVRMLSCSLKCVR